MQVDVETARYYSGLGDLVLLAWLAAGAMAGPDPLVFYRRRDRDLMRLLGLAVTDEPGGVSLDPAFPLEVADRGRRPRLDHVRDFLGLTAAPARPTLHIPSEDQVWAAETANALGSPLVLLFPQVAWAPREWPASYWVDLAWGLKARGVAAEVVLGAEDKRYANTPSYRWGTPVGRLAALMRHADLVVGNDSFPAHLAGTAGTPTLALLGPTRPTVFAHCPDVECLLTTAIDCVGCHFGPPFRAACDQGCQALYRLFPEAVLARALHRLDRR